MLQYTAKDMFQVQNELIDSKVDTAAYKAIDRVIERIDNVKTEMLNRIDALRSEVHDINTRLTAVETKLDIMSLNYREAYQEDRQDKAEIKKEIRRKVIGYVFKIGWVFATCIISMITSFFFLYLHHVPS